MAAAPSDDAYSLIWKPKEGDKMQYLLSLKFSVEGQAFESLSDVLVSVPKVEANGDYTVETLHKNNRIIFGGEEKKEPDGDDEKPDVDKFNAKGERISKDDPVEDQDDLTALLQTVGDLTPPKEPVKKGDTWTEEIKADSKKMIKAARVEYEVLGVTKIGAYDVVRVSMKYKQLEGSKPASYEGTISFDLRDMSVVALEASVEDAPLDEGVTGQVKLKMTRS